MEQKNSNNSDNSSLQQPTISNNGLSKTKKGTGRYMLVAVILAGLTMYSIGQLFGTDGAIITGLLLLIAMASAIRYNI